MLSERIDFFMKYTKEQLEGFLKGNWRARVVAAQHGVGLDVLVHDEDWVVRTTVAEQGYGLEILVNDPCSEVRKAVAMQGYGLEKLVDDDDYHVADAAIDYLSKKYGVSGAELDRVIEELKVNAAEEQAPRVDDILVGAQARVPGVDACEKLNEILMGME